MTYKDKLLKDGVTIEDFEDIYHDWLIKDMVLEPEREMQLNKLDSVMRFLRTPCKLTLTEDERVILRSLPKDYEIIGKCVNGVLYVTTDRKIYLDKAFGGFFNHLFQFIKERRRIRNSRTFKIKYAHLPSSRQSLRTRTRKQTPCACADY